MWGLCRLSIYLFLIYTPLAAFAAVASITEIMFDPEGSDTKREWVKIQNTGDAPIDLTRWKFVEGGVRHSIVATTKTHVLPGEFAVIAVDPVVFTSEYPDFSGPVFDSSFSLKNTGETVRLEDASSTQIASVTYTPKQKTQKPVQSDVVTKKPRSRVGNEAPVFSTSTSIAGVSVAGSRADELPQKSGMGLWFVGLGALIVVGVMGLFLLPKSGVKTGYTIIDISDEDK